MKAIRPKGGTAPFRVLLCLLLTLALPLPRGGNAEAAARPAPKQDGAPIQVTQPAYGGMSFYVSRPRGIPAGWLMTYDGYAVREEKDGLWYYGSRVGAGGIEPTRYAVGAVVPSVMGLVPWLEIPPGPAAGKPAVTGGMAPAYAPPPIYVPPYASVQTAVYTPEWVRLPAFTAIRRWSRNVDRMGILTRPAAPVAWKGRSPKVIYVWTGRAWRQLTPQGEGIAALSLLRRHIYDLAVQVRQGGVPWRDSDSAYLAHYAAQWGYLWMGPLSLVPSEGAYR